ncbi:FG-GAP repeat protein [candidate division KSB1 bacterium]|nr:FG-GAP repeat protein [candidate division KSB1 bacterium]
MFEIGSPDSSVYDLCVSSAGDVNRDGFDDVIVGYLDYSEVEECAGSAYIYFGGENFDSEADLIILGQNTYDFLGENISSAGDVNNDGYSDFLVGIPKLDRTCLYFGSSTFKNNDILVHYYNDRMRNRFGAAVSNAGDYNNDGYHDFIIGAPSDTSGGIQTGRADLHFGGPTLDKTAGIVFRGESAWDCFGRAIACIGDINNDGFSDLAIGAPRYETDEDLVGRVYVYLGNSFKTDKCDLFITGQPMKRIGNAISCAGDVNNDGFDDLIIGAPYLGAMWGPSSYVYIYFGGSTVDTLADVVIQGDFGFGSTVSCAGDMNYDGYDDVMMNDEKTIYFYFGGSEIDTIPDLILPTTNFYERISSLSLAGDVNYDGFKDIIFSTIDRYTEKTWIRKVYIYSGNMTGGRINTLQTITLYQNYPNPFNLTTAIPFSLSEDAHVKISIFDITGRLVNTIVNQPFPMGWHEVIYNGSYISSGIYILQADIITTDQKEKHSFTQKITFLK